MADPHSSTSSSERRSGWPRAALLALPILLGVEAVFRVAVPADAFPYAPNEQEYRVFYHQVLEEGPADVCVLGSSRAREAVVLPELEQALRDAGRDPVELASYALSAGMAEEAGCVTRRIVRGGRKPKLVLYGVTPDQLAAVRLHFENSSLVWDLEEWRRHHDRFGADVLTFLPRSLRNEVGKSYLTFRWRGAMAELLRREPRLLSPIRGGLTIWQETAPYAVAEPSRETVAESRGYLEEMFGRPDWIDPSQRRAIEETAAACREGGVALVFVELPLPVALREGYPGAVYAEFLRELRRIAARYGARIVTLADLGVDPYALPYRDLEHLNLDGASRFTGVLARKVVLPAFRARSAK